MRINMHTGESTALKGRGELTKTLMDLWKKSKLNRVKMPSRVKNLEKKKMAALASGPWSWARLESGLEQ